MNTWEGASNRVRYSCHLEEECQCGDGPVTTCTATGQVVINTDYEDCMSACSSYENSSSLKWTGGTC